MLIHNLLIFEIILAPHQLAHPVVHLTIFVVSFNWCIWSACVHLIVQSWDEGELCAMYTQDIIAGRSLRQTLKQAVARWSVQSVVSCSDRLTRRRTSFSSSRNSNNSSTRTCYSYALHACMRRIHSTWVLNSSHAFQWNCSTSQRTNSTSRIRVCVPPGSMCLEFQFS